MDYKELNDNELIYLCNENNEDAINLIINKYKSCIITILKEYLKEYNIIGIEISDLYQEGLIGLLHAIETFDKNKEVLFYTYACTCIRTNIISAIRLTFRQKNRILNNSYSLDKLFNESTTNYYEIFKDMSQEPDKLLIDEEEQEEMINKLKKKLSKMECNILELKLKGLKNAEIASLIDKDKKFVENTMFRITKKYKELTNL